MARVNTLEWTNPQPLLDAVERGVQRVANEVVRDARRLAPRSPMQPAPRKPGPVTGNLKNSIQVVKRKQEHYDVTVGAPYGMYHEFGTSRMIARPFLGPALENARRKWGF